MRVSTWQTIVSLLVAFCVLAAIALSACVGLLYLFQNTNVKTLNGVAVDTANNIDITAGDGMLVTPDAVTHSVMVENTGVVTINGLPSTALKNIVLAAQSPGLSQTSSGSTITFSNTGVTSLHAGTAITLNGTTGSVLVTNSGVTSLLAGDGITIDDTTGDIMVNNTGVLTVNGNAPTLGDVTIDASYGLTTNVVSSTTSVYHLLTYATNLDDNDPNGNVITYYVAVGFLNPVVENAGWQIGLTAGFPLVFFPGIAFDGGSGNDFGVGWSVPDIGLYHISVDCQIEPDQLAPDDLLLAHVAFSLGATSEDPTASPAYIPPGAYTSINLSTGTNSGTTPPTTPFRISFAATFQAGCVGCLANVGDALNMHAKYTRTGSLTGPYAANFLFTVQVSKLI